MNKVAEVHGLLEKIVAEMLPVTSAEFPSESEFRQFQDGVLAQQEALDDTEKSLKEFYVEMRKEPLKNSWALNYDNKHGRTGEILSRYFKSQGYVVEFEAFHARQGCTDGYHLSVSLSKDKNEFAKELGFVNSFHRESRLGLTP